MIIILLQVLFSLVVAESLYLTYMANKPDDRAKSRGQKGAKHSLMLNDNKRTVEDALSSKS